MADASFSASSLGSAPILALKNIEFVAVVNPLSIMLNRDGRQRQKPRYHPTPKNRQETQELKRLCWLFWFDICEIWVHNRIYSYLYIYIRYYTTIYIYIYLVPPPKDLPFLCFWWFLRGSKAFLRFPPKPWFFQKGVPYMYKCIGTNLVYLPYAIHLVRRSTRTSLVLRY